MASSYDVIVVGAGIEGSSTAYNLVKKGKKVLLLEQFPVPHNRGSSHGQSRITRYAYPHAFYVRMMLDAFPMWTQLEQEYGQTIFVKCGVLDIRQEGSPGSRKLVEALRMYHVPHEVISPSDFRSRYPMFKVEPNVGALLDPSGGFLRADVAVSAFQTVFQRLGGTFKDRCPVTSVIPGERVKVVTPEAVYEAKNVVITAGPWGGRFASDLGLRLPANVYRALIFYWKVMEGKLDMHSTKNMPCFLDYSLTDDYYQAYGVPCYEYPGLVKVCVHGGAPCDPERRDQFDDAEHTNDVIKQVKRLFPFVEDTPAIKETCIITKPPDAHAYMDRHPKHPNIILGFGFSAHGFKLAPVVGKALSELVLGSEPSYDMRPFRLDRFDSKSKL